jgi:hypothetical protein
VWAADPGGGTVAGPRYVRLDVDYFSNPKVVGVSAPARLLHLSAICWSGSQLTDGEIPAAAMRYLMPGAGARRRHLDELIGARLLYEIDGDFVIHDYTAMQDSRADVERKRRLKAERMQRWRDGRE